MRCLILPTNEDLQHHGVQGQEWGHRNGPPYPLNIQGKAALQKQKKKNFKILEKAYKENNKTISNKLKKETTNMAKNMISEETLNNFKTARQDFNKYNIDFADSKEYRQAESEAYKETLDWFKKNEPDYLNTIVKNNNGRTTNLDAFHDFRKTLEGTENIVFSKYEKEFNNKYKDKIAKSNDAWKKYDNAQKQITKEIIGKFGDVKLKDKHYMTYSDILSFNIDYNELINRNK